MGQYGKSHKKPVTGIEQAKQIRDKQKRTICTWELGSNLQPVGLIQKKAIECYAKALEISKQMGDKQGENIRREKLEEARTKLDH